MSRTTVSDGWNYLTLPTPITNVPFSMGCWVYIMNTTGVNRALMSIGDINGAQMNHYTLFIDYDEDTLRSWREYNDAEDYSAGASDGRLTYNEWHHILMVAAATDDILMYTDGVLGQYDTNSVTVANWDTLVVGGTPNLATSYVTAKFADIAVWNTALSEASALALGARCSAQLVQPKNLVAYSPFVLDEDYDYITGTKWSTVGTYASSIGVGSNPPGIIYPSPKHRVIPGPKPPPLVLRAR